MGEYYILPQERVRKKKVNPRWRRRRFQRLAFSIGVLVVLIGLGAALAGSRRWLSSRRSMTVDPASIPRALVLGNLRLNRVDDRWQASGTVVNSSRHVQREVELSLTITNASGGATETPTVRKPLLTPGEVWQFSVDLKEPNASSIRLRRLTSVPEGNKPESST
jgi:hypothetical protein